MKWPLAIGGNIISGIAVIKILQDIFITENKESMLNNIVAYYDRLTAFMFDWMIPYFQPVIIKFSEAFNYNPEVEDVWRSIFIILLFSVIPMIRHSILMSELNIAHKITYLLTGLGALFIAVICALITGIVVSDPATFRDNFLIAFIPMAGMGFYNSTIILAVKDAISDSHNKLSTNPIQFLIELLIVPLIVFIVPLFLPENLQPNYVNSLHESGSSIFFIGVLSMMGWVVGTVLAGAGLIPKVIVGILLTAIIAGVCALLLLIANSITSLQNTGLLVLIFTFLFMSMFRWGLGAVVVAGAAKQHDAEKGEKMLAQGSILKAVGRDAVLMMVGAAFFVFISLYSQQIVI